VAKQSSRFQVVLLLIARLTIISPTI